MSLKRKAAKLFSLGRRRKIPLGKSKKGSKHWQFYAEENPAGSLHVH